jgi:hypothetical protein
LKAHFSFDPPLRQIHIGGVPKSLERKSLPMRLAEIIEAEIKAGDWADSLAGHRTLMERYSVCAKTSLAAIALLEASGLISAGEQGKKRRILVKPEKSGKTLTDLLIIDGTGTQSGEDLLQIQAYREAWEETRGTVQNIKFDFPRYRRPASLLKEAVANHKADAILLHVPPLAWVVAAAKLRPVFLSGGEWRGQQITGVAYDLQEVVALWVERLRKLGHSRIMVPQDFTGPGLEDAVRKGVARGLGIHENSPELRDLCPVFPERLPDAWQQYWKKAFATVRPTAIILTDDIHYLSLCGYCSHHDIRIPRDLSVVCLESTEHLEWCQPVPTRMRFPIEAAAKYFRKWIRGGCRPMGMKYFQLECIEAGSVTQPPKR